MSLNDKFNLHDADLLEGKEPSDLEVGLMASGCLLFTPVLLAGGTVLATGIGASYAVNEVIQQTKRAYCAIRGQKTERVSSSEDNMYPYYRILK